MSRFDRVQELIQSTGWADDKQRQWLAQQGATSWAECSNEVLDAAIEKLSRFDQMFPDAPSAPKNSPRLSIFRDDSNASS